jgi:predicted DNA-binding protein
MSTTVTLGTRIPKGTNDLLTRVSKMSSIPKATLVRQALDSYLADMEEANEIFSEIMKLENNSTKTTPLAEFEDELGL